MEGGEAALKWVCKGSSPSSLLGEDLLESALYPRPVLLWSLRGGAALWSSCRARASKKRASSSLSLPGVRAMSLATWGMFNYNSHHLLFDHLSKVLNIYPNIFYRHFVSSSGYRRRIKFLK